MKHVQFHQIDKILLSRCADLQFTKKRTWLALAIGGVFALALVTMKVRQASISVFFWLSLIYVLITTFDKLSHGLSILAYKRLVLKLVKQISLYEKRERGEADDAAGAAVETADERLEDDSGDDGATAGGSDESSEGHSPPG